MLPTAYAELAALEELEKPNLCSGCRRDVLLASLEVTCELCGKTFNDPEVKQQLTAK